MYVLGIETSCDDTSLCVLTSTNQRPQILAHQSFSADEMLAKWGGVVPELAARNHLAKLAPLLKVVLAQAQISVSQLDLIGVTTYPGLLGPLLTGVNAAKTLALYHQLPIVAVNHLYAHLEAIALTTPVSYPYLGLLASGGHSIFFLVDGPTDFRPLGRTLDDAAGEAFDKGGKLLGLGYPAGHLIDRYAQNGNPHRYQFPIGMAHSKDANLSFSGLKTALRHFLTTHPNPEIFAPSTAALADLCASYQWAIVQALKLKLGFALQLAGERQLPIVVGGGVACNSVLRRELSHSFDQVHFVHPAFCTDNGAMIAHYAYLMRFQSTPFPACLALDAQDRFRHLPPEQHPHG